MTQNEIIEMAKQCGLPLTYVPHYDGTFSPHVDGLVAFANLVAAHEREACAMVCDDIEIVEFRFGGQMYDDAKQTAYACAKAIRARGDQHER